MAFRPPLTPGSGFIICFDPPKSLRIVCFAGKEAPGAPSEIPTRPPPKQLPGPLPDSLGLQDQECSLGEWAEPHAVDADQALGDRSWGRASCGGGAEAVTARRAAGTPILPPSQGQAAERARALWPRPDPRKWGTPQVAPEQPHQDARLGVAEPPPPLAARPPASPLARLLADAPDIAAQRRPSWRPGFAGDSGSGSPLPASFPSSLLLSEVPTEVGRQFGGGCVLPPALSRALK